MATYSNGLIPPSALTKISSGHLLRADAAAAYEAMNVAFRAQFGKRLGVSDGYRPLYGISTPAFSYPHQYSQVGIFEDRYPYLTYAGVNDQRGPWKGKRWWRRTGTAAAAVPGTSNHGWGVALDLAAGVNVLNSPENLWVRANSARFGWVWPSWAQKYPSLEPWHYEFVGTVAFPIGGGTGSISIPNIPGVPGPIQEVTMSAAEVEVLAGHINTVAQEARAFHASALETLGKILTETLNTKAGIWYGGSALIDGVAQKFPYGVLPITAHNQTLIAQGIGRTAALQELVKQVVNGVVGADVDLDAIAAAAEKGVARGMKAAGQALAGSPDPAAIETRKD